MESICGSLTNVRLRPIADIRQRMQCIGMDQANLARERGRWTFLVLMLLWLLPLPFVLVGVAWAGLEPLSPLGLVRDILQLPASAQQVLTSLLLYLYVAWPVASYHLLVRRLRA